jgi:NTE family protein
VPVWNVEENRLDYLGPRTHPEIEVARAVHMAVALPLFLDPVQLDGGSWCDGGVVDILPVRPVLELEPPSDAALVVNCFYPPGFAGEDIHGWRSHRLSILDLAAQVRTAQHLELGRANLERLQRKMPTIEIQPVSHTKVRGVGLYTQFLDSSESADFMRAGRAQAGGRAGQPGVPRADGVPGWNPTG